MLAPTTRTIAHPVSPRPGRCSFDRTLIHLLTSSASTVIMMSDHPRERSLGTRPALAVGRVFFCRRFTLTRKRPRNQLAIPNNCTHFCHNSQSRVAKYASGGCRRPITPLYSRQISFVGRWDSESAWIWQRSTNIVAASSHLPRISTPAGPSPTRASSRPASSMARRIRCSLQRSAL